MSTQPNIYAGPRSDEYETPSDIFDPLHRQYLFSVDLAGTLKNRKVTEHFSADRSFLDAEILNVFHTHWCNPPFSLAEEFFAKIAAHAKRGVPIVCIYKSGNMETKIWRHIFSACTWIAQPHKRVNYLVDGVAPKGGAQFASAIIGFNVADPEVPWEHTLLSVANRR